MVEEAGNRSSIILMNDALNMTLFNNIFVRERQDAYEISARSGQGLQSGANYYYALDIFDSPGVVLIDTDAGSGSITDFTVSEALENFIDPNSNEWVDLSGAWPVLAANRPDFHLLASSVIAAMANPTYLPDTDFLGNLRSGNAAGAYGVEGVVLPTETPGGPTSTPTDVPTSTPTNTPIPGTELLTNVSFETDTDGNKQPDNWTGKNLTGDKQKCNKPDKIIAFNGLCAVQMKGGLAENSKFFQKPDPAALVSGDTLILSAYIESKNALEGSSVAVKGKYADGETKFKEQFIVFAGTISYIQQVTPALILLEGVGKIKVQFNYKGDSGKYYIDQISLVQQSAGGLTNRVSLPPAGN